MVTAVGDDITEVDDDGDEETAVTSSVIVGEENKGVADETDGIITSADTLWTILVIGGLKDGLNPCDTTLGDKMTEIEDTCDTTLGDKMTEIEDTDTAVLDKGTAGVGDDTTEESS